MAEKSTPIRILASAEQVPILQRAIDRRRFLSFAAAMGGTAFLAACSTGGGQTSAAPVATGGELEDSLSIYTWGDYDSPEVVESFTAEFGPQVTFDSYGSNEELISKLVAAKGTSGYDLIVPTGAFIPQMIENDIIQKLNKDLLPNLQYMDPAFLGRSWDPENEYSLCKAWGTTGFVYDKTVITRELKDWNDFLDAAQNEASGRTSVLDWNTTDEAEIDACEDYIVNTLAPHIAAFDSYPGGQAIPQATQVLMQAWNGDARIGILESPDPDRWQWVLGAPQTELWMDNWAIPVGAPHPEAAHAFIDWTMVPENQLLQVDYIGYHTGAAGIEEAAEEAGLEMLDLVFFTEEQISTMQDGEVNEAQQRTVDIWNKAKAAAGA
jgi:spermidine/putrescine transport system substrate-binding protein